MPLLLIRLSAVVFLVSLVSAQQRLTCPQDIHTGLMRDLWKHTRLLINRLPHAIGWLEIRELINIYQRSVFSSEVIQKLLHPHYNDLMYGLQHTLRHCVSSSESSKYSKIMKKLEKRINKRNGEGDEGDDGVLKAVREFTYILRWINELTHHHTP
ncbi:ribonuclease H2 subunit A [Sarotherodon galilaeus]